MVIECPSCKTRFAIDAQQLSGAENPRFHCSRCGHLFEMPEKQPPEPPAPAPDAAPQVMARAAAEPEIDNGDFSSPALPPEPVPEQLALAGLEEQDRSSAPASRAQNFRRDEISEMMSSFEEEPLVTASWPEQSGERTYEVDLSALRTQLLQHENRRPLGRERRTFRSAEARMPARDYLGAQQIGPARVRLAPDAGSDPASSWTIGQSFSTPSFSAAEESSADYLAAKPAQIVPSELSADDCAINEPSVYETLTPDWADTELVYDSWSGGRFNEYPETLTGSEPGAGLGEDQTALASPSAVDANSAGITTHRELLTETPLSRAHSTQNAPGWLGAAEAEDSSSDAGSAASSSRQRRRQAYHESLALAVEQELNAGFAEQDSGLDAGDFDATSAQELSRFRRLLNSIRPVAVFAAVPALLVLLFWTWSRNLDNSPLALKRVFALDTAQLPKLPPPGLVLVDVRSQVISLDNGRKVLEVRGELLNATLKSFADIKLEARIFDQQNNVLHQRSVDLNNPLVNAYLNALSEDAIDSLQSSRGAAEGNVKPNQKIPFRIVFTKLSGAESWFGARILSVLSL